MRTNDSHEGAKARRKPEDAEHGEEKPSEITSVTSVTFLQSGESPEFGAFVEGEKKTLPRRAAETLISRGVATTATKED